MLATGNLSEQEGSGTRGKPGIHSLLLAPASLPVRHSHSTTTSSHHRHLPADEINLETGKIQCKLNGDLVQSSTLGQLIFKPNQIVAFMSTICTLQPGDIIFTGTPWGVGFAKKPPVYLKVRPRFCSPSASFHRKSYFYSNGSTVTLLNALWRASDRSPIPLKTRSSRRCGGIYTMYNNNLSRKLNLSGVQSCPCCP